MNIKISHKVFHLEEATERKQYADSINKYLQPYSNDLNTKTIRISDQSDFLKEIQNNPDFNLDFNGYNLNYTQGWRYGEVGLWISNFLAWKEFSKSESNIGIFMEDDILYSSDFIDLLLEYISEIPEDWDAFFFAVPPGQFHKYDSASMDFGANNTCRVYQDHWMLCYVLSKSGVLKAIDSVFKGVSLPLDWHFFRQRHLFNSYTVKPSSKFACSGSPTETTFQNQERKVMKIDS
jgi:GR25 family glycosyltransferase involved in LPS biosynthesis